MVDRGRRLGEVTLQIPGRHYVLDALAALACGLRLGLRLRATWPAGSAAFSGTRRRMELKGQVDGVRVYDSYAHHPNEIAGDLQAARSLAGEGRVVVAFQPHMVSRTRIFGHDMGVALGAADEVVVMDIYVAREDPEPGCQRGHGRRRRTPASRTTWSSSRRGPRSPATSSTAPGPETSCSPSAPAT